MVKLQTRYAHTHSTPRLFIRPTVAPGQSAHRAGTDAARARGAYGTVLASGDRAAHEQQLNAVTSLLDAGMPLAAVEDAMLAHALARSSGNRSAATRLIGLSRAQFIYRLAQVAEAAT